MDVKGTLRREELGVFIGVRPLCREGVGDVIMRKVLCSWWSLVGDGSQRSLARVLRGWMKKRMAAARAANMAPSRRRAALSCPWMEVWTWT